MILNPDIERYMYGLLPPPLRRRDVQSVGRLDEDTTGLLLFTDDGALIHRLTSPKRHVRKVYRQQASIMTAMVQRFFPAGTRMSTLVESCGSWLAIVLSMIAQSRTVRAIGPA